LGWVEADVLNGEAPLPEPAPLADRLKATEYKGEYGLNQAILDLPIDRLTNGVPVKDVIAECEALARAVWDKLPDDHPEKDKW
jgi:hypothetical protein